MFFNRYRHFFWTLCSKKHMRGDILVTVKQGMKSNVDGLYCAIHILQFCVE